MSNFGSKLAALGCATQLKGGKLGAPEKKAAPKPQSNSQWERNKHKINDEQRAADRKEWNEETQGEAMASKWKKKRDQDKIYFGGIDQNLGKQFKRTAIGSKPRGYVEEKSDTDSDLDSDDRELLNDPELAKLQRNRLARMKAEFEAKKALKATGHGSYDQMDEEEMLKMSRTTDYVVCSFYHKDFERCKIMDHHLSILARKHMSARFVKLDVQKAPFMAQKMRIKTLPSVCVFIDAVLVDKIIGFNDFGGADDFHTVVLENRLVKTGVIPDKHGRRTRKSKKTQTLLDNMGKREFYDDELDL